MVRDLSRPTYVEPDAIDILAVSVFTEGGIIIFDAVSCGTFRVVPLLTLFVLFASIGDSGPGV